MIINSQEIEYRNFYRDFIQSKKPILIKSAFKPNTLNKIVTDKKDKIKPLYSRGAAPFLYTYFDDSTIRNYVFNLPIIKCLLDNPNTQFREKMRLWHHNKGNISYFHYDQRSTDLLNICLSGSKQWLLLPPDAPLKCWPFYNIALPFQRKKKKQAISLIMEQGDLIYIPRNWFHQLMTLEHNTKNINLIFNDLTDNQMATRERELTSIKRLFIPNYIYGDNIAMLNNTIDSVPILKTLARLFRELLPIFIFIFITIIFLSIQAVTLGTIAINTIILKQIS
ncbi:hypothetical protein FGD67_11130 [Colwellia sp. M166]|uniref:cupin-like domain-containing protein n=1 Tax=Colwellia sp. M166 TaxID=2583805 RepID=UPI00211E5A7B|nr:cupin-like domain-containing protein [Colwellia sp. M166]UUO23728.1 hypothetical protein FGD67_11130 [Colwellia sp. M166]|tara:strand:+ start:4070 stop:4909 length:840 start_codon:yes stop_codon:yes gene_type:complete